MKSDETNLQFWRDRFNQCQAPLNQDVMNKILKEKGFESLEKFREEMERIGEFLGIRPND